MTQSTPDTFAAFVGIDWADAKHDACLQAAGSAKRECFQLEHTPEAIDAWVTTLRTRFHGQPVAVCLELDKGPLVSALRTYDFLVLFPINPLTLARYREAFTHSRAKDDPTDAALQLELLLTHRDKLHPLTPQSATMRALTQLVEHRRRVAGPEPSRFPSLPSPSRGRSRLRFASLRRLRGTTRTVSVRHRPVKICRDCARHRTQRQEVLGPLASPVSQVPATIMRGVGRR